MKRGFLKKCLIAGLSVTLLAGGNLTIYAHHKPGHHIPPGQLKKQKNSTNIDWDKIVDIGKQLKLDFSDLKGVEWARKHIASLASMQVFEGYDDGTFRPNKPVTRLEAVITAVRLMDLRAEAEAAYDRDLNFKDANIIKRKYPQAVGYVAIALENDLISSQTKQFQPDQPATRLWLAEMLVKAMGLEAEALQRKNEKLKFKDTNTIPADLIGYVAVAVEKGIVFGYENNTFRPDRPVTRAEIAAFLDRASTHLSIVNESTVTGQLVEKVKDDQLLLRTKQGLRQFEMDEQTFVFLDGKRVKVSNLKQGDELLVRLYHGVVVFVDVIERSNSSNQDDKDKHEMISFVASVANVDRNRIVLNESDTKKAYIFDKDLQVRLWNGKEGKQSDLRQGLRVFVQVQGSQLKFVHILDDHAIISQKGTIVAAVEEGNVTIYHDGRTSTYSIAKNAKLTRNKQDVKADALLVQDKVEVNIENGEIIELNVTDPAAVHSQLTAVLAAAGSGNKLTVQTSDHLLQYEIDEDAIIYRKEFQVNPSDLRVGDQLQIQVLHNRIIALEVSKTASGNSSFAGTLKGAVTHHRISVEMEGLTVEYALADEVKVFRDGKEIRVRDLRKGDQVNVLVIDEEAVLITVTKSTN